MNGWVTLKEMGFLTRHATAEERKVIGEIDGFDFGQDLTLIRDYYPDLLTDEARKYLADLDKMGKYSPLVTVKVAPSQLMEVGTATEKQKAYLRALGVRDQEHVVAHISKKHASQLIEQVEEFRAKNGLPT